MLVWTSKCHSYPLWKNTANQQLLCSWFFVGTFNISSCIRAPTSTLMPLHILRAIINSAIVRKKWHLYQGTIKENVCIKINTHFIQMLMMKDRKFRHWEGNKCYDEGMTGPYPKWHQMKQRKDGNSLNYSSLSTITTIQETATVVNVSLAVTKSWWKSGWFQNTRQRFMSCVIAVSSYRNQELNLEALPGQWLMRRLDTKNAREMANTLLSTQDRCRQKRQIRWKHPETSLAVAFGNSMQKEQTLLRDELRRVDQI